MRWLLTIGVLLILIGGGGGIAACFATSAFDRPRGETAAQLDGTTDALANNSDDDETPPLWLMPLAGVTFAIGIVCIAIGMGDWRRPLPSEMRPDDPRSNRRTDHGEPPRGLA